jgi:RHH-type proline utilization regulon transcriptional repressor/proline dehydrogenase/delta 1-pyrroline-5-carboxylate dehydrogenase
VVTATDPIPTFSAPYAGADEKIAARFLAQVKRSPAAEARIDARAGGLIGAIRARIGGLGGVEDFLHAYALSTKEGLALMVLAEALLRVPDPATADRLIEDKLSAGDWSHHDGRSASPRGSSSPARRRRALSRRW